MEFRSVVSPKKPWADNLQRPGEAGHLDALATPLRVPHDTAQLTTPETARLHDAPRDQPRSA